MGEEASCICLLYDTEDFLNEPTITFTLSYPSWCQSCTIMCLFCDSCILHSAFKVQDIMGIHWMKVSMFNLVQSAVHALPLPRSPPSLLIILDISTFPTQEVCPHAAVSLSVTFIQKSSLFCILVQVKTPYKSFSSHKILFLLNTFLKYN